MPCILYFIGGFNIDYDLLINFLETRLSFISVQLPVLTADDFENNKVKEDVKREIIRKTEEITIKKIKNWKCRHMLFPIYFKEQTLLMHKRAYINLIQLKQPLLLGFEKYKKKTKSELTLESFIKMEDCLNFQTDVKNLQYFTRHCIDTTNFKTIENSFKENQFLKRIYIDQFRPSMDEYFMSIAYLARLRSNCMKRAVGCVITKNKRIISIGYNGTPVNCQNCFQGGCERCNNNTTSGVDLDKCLCLHAEDSAILEIGAKAAEGSTLYTTLFPCTWCSKVIIQCVF